MIEIEKKLIAAGWTAQGRRNDRVESTTANHEDQHFILMNPDHIQTGGLLAKQGKLDEAANVYRRILEKCRARLAREPTHAETRQTLELVVLRFRPLGRTIYLSRSFSDGARMCRITSRRCA